ncbi:MAG: metal ABC transporter ATP-binding protein [Rickettsiaceae bacterium]|nr:metal ABC transporter ATP-binding protein [Rickettsiaceae bacterium]
MTIAKNNDIILEFENISKNFNNKTIIESVSFKIHKNTINVLVGPNGAGKSTIAKILLGIEDPSLGRVIKNDYLRVSYVPQAFKISDQVPLTCKEFAYLCNINRENFMDSIYEKSSDIDKIWSKDLSTLSSGQLQFFLLAIAFSSNPDLVVLDEPTAFLDVDLEDIFYSTIEKVKNKSKKMSIFLISHDLHHVISSADQVLCINHHICCSGKPFKTHNSLSSNIGVYKHTHDHRH